MRYRLTIDYEAPDDDAAVNATRAAETAIAGVLDSPLVLTSTVLLREYTPPWRSYEYLIRDDARIPVTP